MVFDTNIFIAAILTEGLCSRLLRRARLKDFFLIVCPCIIDEIKKVLSDKFKFPQYEISTSIDIINEALTDMIDADMPVISICKGRDDNKIIACALVAKAHYLVTGDAELLELRQYKNIKIISPRDFELLFK